MDNIPLFAWVEVLKVGPLPAFKAVFAGRGAEGWTSTVAASTQFFKL